MLAERGLDISDKTVRRWSLDEMVVVIAKQRFYLCRAVDGESKVRDFLIQRHRNTTTAEKLMRKLLTKQGIAPVVMVTDKLPSYGDATKKPGLKAVHEQGLRKNNRYENSHLPVRQRKRQQRKFNAPGSAQRVLKIMPLFTPSSTSTGHQENGAGWKRHLMT